MKWTYLKRVIFVLLTIIVAVCVMMAVKLCYFRYTDIWKYCADFESYEEEFVLVRDYVKTYMNGKSGMLSLSFQESHKYDLYDSDAKAYLDCPQSIRNALEVISKQAFYYKDAQFETIYCDTDQVSFSIISGPYRLVYRPEGEPTIPTYYDSQIVFRKKIKAGWYHVRALEN